MPSVQTVGPNVSHLNGCIETPEVQMARVQTSPVRTALSNVPETAMSKERYIIFGSRSLDTQTTASNILESKCLTSKHQNVSHLNIQLPNVSQPNVELPNVLHPNSRGQMSHVQMSCIQTSEVQTSCVERSGSKRLCPNVIHQQKIAQHYNPLAYNFKL